MLDDWHEMSRSITALGNPHLDETLLQNVKTTFTAVHFVLQNPQRTPSQRGFIIWHQAKQCSIVRGNPSKMLHPWRLTAWTWSHDGLVYGRWCSGFPGVYCILRWTRLIFRGKYPSNMCCLFDLPPKLGSHLSHEIPLNPGWSIGILFMVCYIFPI